MALLEIIKMGNPMLREISKEVSQEEISSANFQTFIDDLVETMRFHSGAGIAAPQVGTLKRIFTMEMRENTRYPDKESFPLHIIINPNITFLNDHKTDSWEGCLSIPGIRGKLSRYERISLTGIDRAGNPIEKELEGFASIVAQHELDHLDGVLLIDRMESMHTLTFQDEYETYWLKK
ncbi:MAG: peptide deformylase [Cyclobacteriaceae bacterium]